MRVRDVVAVLGVTLGLWGILSALAPGFAGPIVGRLVPIQLVGIGAALMALSGYLARRRAVRSRADTPLVEEPIDCPRPGSDIDDSLYRATTIGSVGRGDRASLRDHLWNVAVAVVQVTEGRDEETAKARLRNENWTDDPRAVSMFAAEPPETPLGDVVRGLVTGRSQFYVNIAATISALRRKLEGDS